jgi:hypothetical protein
MWMGWFTFMCVMLVKRGCRDEDGVERLQGANLFPSYKHAMGELVTLPLFVTLDVSSSKGGNKPTSGQPK